MFAPLLIYFCASGAWQLFGWNEASKNESRENIFHEMSRPHLRQSSPTASAKKGGSPLFKWFSLAMATGIIATAILGIQMAFKVIRPWWVAALALLGGVLVPLAMLMFAT